MRKWNRKWLLVETAGLVVVIVLVVLTYSTPVQSYYGVGTGICQRKVGGRWIAEPCRQPPSSSSSSSSYMPAYTPQYKGCSRAGHAFANLMVAHMTRRGRPASSRPAYRKRAIDINNRGVVYGNRGNYAEAVKYYRRALAVDPNNKIIRHNLAVTLNALGIARFKKGDYRSALKYFDQALKAAPDRKDIAHNRRIAGEAVAGQGAMGRTESARHQARMAILRAQAARQAEQMRLLAQAENKREVDRFKRRNQEVLRREVLKAAEAFRRNRVEWLRRKQAQVRAAIHNSRDWFRSIKAALQKKVDPIEDHRPKGPGDLSPGDIILVAPNDPVSRGIRLVDNFYIGLLWHPRSTESPASHALTFIGRGKTGQALFLDNQINEGPRIIGWPEFSSRYGHRTQFVAKVVPPVDGRVLLRYARQAATDSAQKRWRFLVFKGSAYGLVRQNVVCSETAATAVGLATGIELANKGRLLIDITPADFFDNQNAGKYFIVSPFNPGNKQERPRP